MIRAVKIERFRGIRECVADGFGRVNLIIGRNDCGKTAFMEALEIADDARDAAHVMRTCQRRRLGRAAKSHDFERFWRPLFLDLDAKAGFAISATRDDDARNFLEARQGTVDGDIVVDRHALQGEGEHGSYELEDDVVSPAWAIDLDHTGYDRTKTQLRMVAMPGRLKLPPVSGESGSAWILSGANVDEHEVRHVSTLKQRGQDTSLVELLREIDGRVSGIELLAPGGSVAELFVRMDRTMPLLPVGLMGDGFQRCLELGAAAAADDWPTMFIDEIENGMHHLVLEPLWRWIAKVARQRNLQVFATTHSEECIHAASRAFHSLDDDGLRVIRLDRLDRSTRATIYDRALVETAERTGTEIRG